MPPSPNVKIVQSRWSAITKPKKCRKSSIFAALKKNKEMYLHEHINRRRNHLQSLMCLQRAKKAPRNTEKALNTTRTKFKSFLKQVPVTMKPNKAHVQNYREEKRQTTQVKYSLRSSHATKRVSRPRIIILILKSLSLRLSLAAISMS